MKIAVPYRDEESEIPRSAEIDLRATEQNKKP